MGDFSKKLLGIFLGISLSLGVGVSLSNSVHREAVGVRAATEVATAVLTFKTNGKDSGDGSNLATDTVLSNVFEDTSAVKSIDTATKAYYNGFAGLKLGTSSNNGVVEFSLKNPLTAATKAVVNAKLYNSSKSATLKIDECSDSAKSLSSDFKDYEFTFTSKSVSSIKLTSSQYCWISSITLYEEVAVPTVTGVTLMPSETTTIIVGNAKEFIVGIQGTDLTKDEVVSASYTEYELEEDGILIDKTSDIKNGEVIKATALLANANGLLEIKYNDTIYASVEINTEAAKTPTKLEYSGTLITSYVAGQSFDPTGLTFKVFYGDDDTTGTEVDVEHITFDPSTLSEDTTSVTGSYTENDVTVSFTINGISVEEDYIADVIFDTDNAKTTYQIGEEWIDSESGVTGLGEYKVNKDNLLDLVATDFTYSGYDSSVAGKQTITVTYPNSKSEKPFSTTYTVNVISETLEQLVSEGDGYYHLVTDYTTLSAGDKIVIAENTKSVVSGDLYKDADGVYGSYLTKTTGSTFSSDKKTITSLGDGAFVFTLDGDSTAWHLLNDNGDMLGAYAVKKLTWDSTADNYNSDWTFTSFTSTVDGVTYTGTAITNGGSKYGKILYNNDSGKERFLNYTSDISAKMLIPQIYKLSEDVYQTHDASLALVNTVKSIYNDGYLSCDTNGANSTIKWVEIANLFASNVTDADELEFLKEALSDETAANGTIKKFLADYDYILGKYNAAPYSKGYADFLGRNIAASNSANRIYKSNDNNSTITIVLVVALSSVTVFGGYFFIKKRKYN